MVVVDMEYCFPVHDIVEDTYSDIATSTYILRLLAWMISIMMVLTMRMLPFQVSLNMNMMKEITSPGLYTPLKHDDSNIDPNPHTLIIKKFGLDTAEFLEKHQWTKLGAYCGLVICNLTNVPNS